MNRHEIIEKVYTFTGENALFSPPCHVLVGVSGGADSMALLGCLLNWPVAGVQVTAVHVHHGLRAEEADRDARFVREQCALLGVPLVVRHLDVAAEAATAGEGLEEAGRRLRYAVFDEVAKTVQADFIATAHTANDQTETVLMHLLRGSGVDGLAGIPAKRQNIVRPLLSCAREEIEAFCAAQNIAFVQDSTNQNMQFTRNRVRHELLPFLRQFNPAADVAIRRLASHAAQDSACLRTWAQKALEQAQTAEGFYAVKAFTEQPSSIRRRMIMALLAADGCYTVEEKHILAIEQMLLKNAGSTMVSGGRRLLVTGSQIGFVTQPDEHPEWSAVTVENLPQRCACGCFSGVLRLLSAKEYEQYKNVHKMFFKYALDYDKIQGDLIVRTWLPGDTMHPASRGVGKSLKKIWQETAVSASDRHQRPLVCDAHGVVLIPGICCDERVSPCADTKLFLVWEPCSE